MSTTTDPTIRDAVQVAIDTLEAWNESPESAAAVETLRRLVPEGGAPVAIIALREAEDGELDCHVEFDPMYSQEHENPFCHVAAGSFLTWLTEKLGRA